MQTVPPGDPAKSKAPHAAHRASCSGTSPGTLNPKHAEAQEVELGVQQRSLRRQDQNLRATERIRTESEPQLRAGPPGPGRGGADPEPRPARRLAGASSAARRNPERGGSQLGHSLAARGRAMLALRSGLNRALALRTPAPQACSSFATGPRQNEGTFYEFRTYYLKPSKMNKFLENFEKSIHLRTAYSELVGYWRVEFGGRMNRAFQIWKYDNFAHRTAVRKALANNKEWQEQFLIPNLPFIDKQESEITYLVPWCQIGKPPKEGVYELATFKMKPGGPALWGDAFERAVKVHANQGYTKLIGVFHTEYGALNRVHVLWWNENPDCRAAGRHRSHEDPRVVAAVRESVSYLESQQNMLLIPKSFSPLK